MIFDVLFYCQICGGTLSVNLCHGRQCYHFLCVYYLHTFNDNNKDIMSFVGFLLFNMNRMIEFFLHYGSRIVFMYLGAIIFVAIASIQYLTTK